MMPMTVKQAPDPNPNPKPRCLTPCHRHPDQLVTTLCPHCLRERLSLLNPSTSSSSSSSSGDASAAVGGGVASSSSSVSSSSATAALPELRRCKTFSGKNCESVGLAFEPRRRSCEVRNRNTLEALFSVDDDEASDSSTGKCEVESKNLGLLKGTYPVPELKEEEGEEEEESDDEIRVSAVDVIAPNVNVIDDELNVEEFEDSRTMKEFIDLEFERNRKPVGRDFMEIAGSFWTAASVFSRKFQKWKKKQKSALAAGGDCGEGDGNGGGGRGFGGARLENLRGRRLRETQSEVGEYALGRRSCDTDPRVSVDPGLESVDWGRISVDGIGSRICDADPSCSIDHGRASIDCGRISVDQEIRGSFNDPKASWDGYLNGRPIPRGATAAATPMVSVIENAMATVYGFDNRALVVDKLKSDYEDGRRRSFDGFGHFDSVTLRMQKKGFGFDQSNSQRNMNMVMTQDDGEAKSACHTKKLAPPPIELFQGTKLLISEKELMGSRISSHRDDSSDSFNTSSKEMNSSVSSSSTGNESRKLRKWSKFLNVLGLFAWRRQGNDRETENCNGTDVKHSLTNAAKKNLKYSNGEDGLDSGWKLVRSHSVISSRSSTLRREDVILERNRSSRYSPNHLDNGLLRFYLTPSRSSRRKSGKSRFNRSHSYARNV